MMKWTPGPWAVHPFRAYVVPATHLSRPIGCDTDDAIDLREFAQEICLMHWPDRHRAESEVKANARLIAAAPELYDMLTEAARQIEYLHEKFAYTGSGEAVLAQIQHALAKARGEA